jgi:hypothetical protein
MADLTAQIETLRRMAGHLRQWPAAYGMGAHDTNICVLAADACEQLAKVAEDLQPQQTGGSGGPRWRQW